MIVEIIFSDYYRTFLLCILSMGVTFFIRKFSVKEGVLALVMYEFIMLIPFVWILIVSVVFTEFNFQQIIEIVQWELKWIIYFTTCTVLQFIMYYLFWKRNVIYKIGTLPFCVTVVVVPLYVINFN